MTVAAIAVVLAVCPTASAQLLDEGQTEFFGLVGGYTKNGGAALGGGIHYGFMPRLLFSGEAAYATGSGVSGTITSPGQSPVNVGFGSSGFAIDGNVHYLFPLENNQNFTPYVLGGIGCVRSRVDSSFDDFSASFSSTSAGLNLGGGVRWQLGGNWGLRPEVKLFAGDGSHARFSVAAYFRFK